MSHSKKGTFQKEHIPYLGPYLNKQILHLGPHNEKVCIQEKFEYFYYFVTKSVNYRVVMDFWIPPETCRKPAGNLPETFVNWFLAGFWQVSGRFPAGFRQVSDK